MITVNLNTQKRLRVLQLLRIPLVAFVILCIVPLVLYGLFAAEIIKAPSEFSSLEAAVARVTSSDGTGTAFLVSDTYLLTARHVISDKKAGENVEVSFERVDPVIARQATVVWMAPSSVPLQPDGSAPLEYFLTDVALLKLSEPIQEIAPLALGISSDVANLDEVIIIGYPAGDFSISEGNINSTSYQDKNLFKLDATSNPGNSGGPCILRKDNSVVGILVGGPGSPFVDGENVAVKIDDVLGLMKADSVSVK